MHCALYHRIRRLRIHGVQQNVNDFIASGTKDRRTENLFCISINSDFDEALSFSLLNGPAYSLHRKAGNQRTAAGFSDICVRHTTAA